MLSTPPVAGALRPKCTHSNCHSWFFNARPFLHWSVKPGSTLAARFLFETHARRDCEGLPSLGVFPGGRIVARPSPHALVDAAPIVVHAATVLPRLPGRCVTMQFAVIYSAVLPSRLRAEGIIAIQDLFHSCCLRYSASVSTTRPKAHLCVLEGRRFSVRLQTPLCALCPRG